MMRFLVLLDEFPTLHLNRSVQHQNMVRLVSAFTGAHRATLPVLIHVPTRSATNGCQECPTVDGTYSQEPDRNPDLRTVVATKVGSHRLHLGS